MKKEREVLEESLELLDQSDLQEREYETRMARSDCMNCSQTIKLQSVYVCNSFQGAPGNRGFPGQDGLAGAKVGPV